MAAPSVLYVVTEPWYFAHHRLDHARALLDDGFDVHVATRRGDRWDELVGAGCRVHELDVARGSGSVASWWREIRSMRRLVRAVRPDIVHAVALKPLALALALLPMRRRPALILSVNGFGISAADGGLGVRVIRGVIRTAGRMRRVHLLFQTRADQHSVLGNRDGGVVIPGVGVDIETFVPLARPATPPCVIVYLGRAVASKGLPLLADAVANGEVRGVELHLYCAIDESSPGALSPAELARLERCPQITLHPATRDAAAVIGRAHAAILPSIAGEGVSKFVLESLACGTPVVLSAESGSGEVIVEGQTGVTFTAGGVESLRVALSEVAGWSDERRALIGAACRVQAVERFGLDVVLPQVVALHRDAVGAR